MKRLLPSSVSAGRHPRSGAFLIIAMICLLLTSALLGRLLQTASIERRQVRLEADVLQAEWLAESALDRAAAKLSADDSYKGETWTLTAKELGGTQAGRAVIRVLPAKSSEQKILDVVAHYPAEGSHSVQRSKQIRYSPNPPAQKPPAEAPQPATAEKPAA